MATGGNKETGSELLKIGTLRLGSDDLDPWGIVVVGDKLVITDRKSDKVRVYRRHDGMLLSSSDELESWPWGVCCVNDTDFCVVMWHGIMTFMSVSDSGLICRGATFHLTPSFDCCHDVAAFRDNVVVSGVKDNTICWCIVSMQDGRHDNLHKVCGRGVSHITTKENMAYIACDAYDSRDDNGVYGFNLLNPSQPPYKYKSEEMSSPCGITVDDNGYLFVCDGHSIYHLTEKYELVAIYTFEWIPDDSKNSIFTTWSPQFFKAIFWDRGILYLTAEESNEITMYEARHQGLKVFGSTIGEETLKARMTSKVSSKVGHIGYGGAFTGTVASKLTSLEFWSSSDENLPKQLSSETLEMTADWNLTTKDLQDAWQSLEVYLSEELHPNCLLIFFEKKRLLSAEECEDMCKLRRRQIVKELMHRIKAKLPEAFSSFLHALNETKQQIIVQGLRQHIEGIDVPQHSTHGQETNAVAYYTLNMEMLKDGNTLHETESKTRAFMDKGCMVFYFEMRSQCFMWESGSVIVYLRPLGKVTKERLDLFCQHGGMKNFLLDLLKKKDIFASLPGGEISIHIQVCCYDKDISSEVGDMQIINEHSVIQDSFRVTDSFIVTDKTEVIKQNLLNQYEYMIEEIEPLNFKDTFVSRGILDERYFEKFKMRRRKERATDFLKEVLVKGSAALEALVHDLRDSGLDELVRRLCIAPEKDEGQVNDGMIEVLREDSASPESMVFTIRKTEDGDKSPEDTESNVNIQSVTSETSVPVEQVDRRVTHEECQKPLRKRALLPGKKYHAFFSYSNSDIEWVKQTVETLERDHGFVCCEYDRDNTPGTPLLKFADDSIKNAYKIVIVMSKEAFKSGFVLLEIQMAMKQGFSESRDCVVPVLLEDCDVPGYLSVLNYVDARDTKQKNLWWPKLVTELET